MAVITNVTIEKLTEEENYDLKRSFVDIFCLILSLFS